MKFRKEPREYYSDRWQDNVRFVMDYNNPVIPMLTYKCRIDFCSQPEMTRGLCSFHNRSYIIHNKITIKERITKAMATVRQKIKEALLTKEQRLVRKYNIVNSDGSPNVQGRKILADVLFEENFDKVIERLKLIDEEEKKSK